MTARIGTLLLGGALVAAVASTLLWLRVALLRAAPRPARAATGALFGCALLACAALEVALVRHDFSIRYVAENGGRDVPLYYTLTGLWAALDGSLLLWLLVLAGCAVLLGRGRARRTAPMRDSALRPWASAVLGVVAVFFCALTYFSANPFTTTATTAPAPADGAGPNPLLREHPAMGVHPPLLYAGYVAFAVPFALGVAALVTGDADRGTVVLLRRWTLLAWSLLTAGITLGAWWSYAVLGWGGYWAWDPVENASLLPWLTATAALHTLVPARRVAALRARTVALSCATFLLVLIGTLLTRSGAVASVHAFSASPLGPMLLGFVLLATGAVLVLFARRAPWSAGGAPAPLLSRRGVLSATVVLLVALAATVLTGTLFPLIAQAVEGRAATVGPDYFNRGAVPVALAVLALMGLAPLLHAGRAPDVRALRVPAVAGLATAAGVGQVGRPGPMAVVASALGAFVLAGLVPAARRRLGAPGRLGWVVAHAGVAVLAVGVAVSSGYTVAAERRLAVGEQVSAGGVTARLSGVERNGNPAGMTVTARLVLRHGTDPLGTQAPSLRYFPGRDTTVSVPAIRSRPSGDVYATVLGVDDDGSAATVRLAVNPLVGLVWLGGGLIALGGLLSLLRPLRAGRRGERRRAAPAEALGVPA